MKEVPEKIKFALNAPENLEAICNGKKRIFDSMKLPNEEIFAELLVEQIEKDVILNSINKRILSLKYKIASKGKSAKLATEKKQLKALDDKMNICEMDKNEAIIKVEALREEIAKRKELFGLEKAKNQESFKALQVEIASGKETQITQKKQLEEAKNDLKELEKLFAGISELNKTIEKGLEEKGIQGKETSDKYYEKAMSMEDIDFLEIAYTEFAQRRSDSLKKLQKKQKEFAKIEKIFKEIVLYEEKVEELIRNLGENGNFDAAKTLKALGRSKVLIEEIKEMPRLILPKANENAYKEDENEIMGKVAEIQGKIQSLDKELEKINMSSNSVELSKAKQLFATFEQENIEKIQKSQKKIEETIGKYKANKGLFEVQLRKNQEKEIEIIQTKIKIESNKSKTALIQTLNNAETKTLERLKNQLNSLLKAEKAKIPEFENENLSQIKKKLANLPNQVIALHEEILKKDSQIIKKIRENLQVKTMIKDAEESIKYIDQKNEETIEQLYGRVGHGLSEKNKEIEMLKEIVRGNASEIRNKEMSLNGIKKKLKGQIEVSQSTQTIRKPSI